MIDGLQEVFNINFSYVFISVITILVTFKGIVALFEWVFEKFGIETAAMRTRREDHQLLTDTSKTLLEFREQYKRDMIRPDAYDKEILQDIKNLKEMLLKKEIDDTRWAINDFANQISDGVKCNKDSFKHVLKMYARYQEILNELHMTNGEIEVSISIIRKAYEQKMQEGF